MVGGESYSPKPIIGNTSLCPRIRPVTMFVQHIREQMQTGMITEIRHSSSEIECWKCFWVRDSFLGVGGAIPVDSPCIDPTLWDADRIRLSKKARTGPADRAGPVWLFLGSLRVLTGKTPLVQRKATPVRRVSNRR